MIVAMIAGAAFSAAFVAPKPWYQLALVVAAAAIVYLRSH